MHAGEQRTVCIAASESPSVSFIDFKPTPPRFWSLNWSTVTLLPRPCTAKLHCHRHAEDSCSETLVLA